MGQSQRATSLHHPSTSRRAERARIVRRGGRLPPAKNAAQQPMGRSPLDSGYEPLLRLAARLANRNVEGYRGV